MSRKIAILSICGLLLASAAQGQFWDPPDLVNRNASGFYYYMLEVPDHDAMVMDGYDDDWAWFDSEYIITMDEWRDEGDRPLPSRDELDITTKMGWKGDPHNRWYVFMHIHDDTLRHDGTAVNRWSGDMIGFCLDPQDHGRDRGNGGYSLEWIAAPGDVVGSNFQYRYPEGEGLPGFEAWAAYGEPPWLEGHVRVEPPEAWAADLWTSDTGGDTYYEWNLVVLEYLEDGGPEVSQVRDLNAVAGEDGFGLPFVFFVEDGNEAFRNDMTVRAAEASARQYFAMAKLLPIGDYTPGVPTSVESTTWGRIKGGF